ncbi:MAG: hypothetical protein IKS83_09405 [Victivallales bacterium]|nr:hypothetical protein [Victivallales bacterium]
MIAISSVSKMYEVTSCQIFYSRSQFDILDWVGFVFWGYQSRGGQISQKQANSGWDDGQIRFKRYIRNERGKAG